MKQVFLSIIFLHHTSWICFVYVWYLLHCQPSFRLAKINISFAFIWMKYPSTCFCVTREVWASQSHKDIKDVNISLSQHMYLFHGFNQSKKKKDKQPNVENQKIFKIKFYIFLVQQQEKNVYCFFGCSLLQGSPQTQTALSDTTLARSCKLRITTRQH